MMNKKIAGAVLAASIVCGGLMGWAWRRNRVAGPSAPPNSTAPIASSLQSALVHREIDDLVGKMDILRKESMSLEAQRDALARTAIPQPAAPPAPEPEEPLEKLAQRLIQRALAGDLELDGRLDSAVREQPSRFVDILRAGTEALRTHLDQVDHHQARRNLEWWFEILARTVFETEEDRRKLAGLFWEAQASEADPAVRGWMLRVLPSLKSPPPEPQAAAIARELLSTRDPELKRGLFASIASLGVAWQLELREAIDRTPDPDMRTEFILTAWKDKALPSLELKGYARALMESDHPEPMIERITDWLPRFVSPLAPGDTVALLNQSLSKPIDPYHKSIVLASMAGIAAALPWKSGRDEIQAFTNATDDERLKKVGQHFLEIIDRGGSYKEVLNFNPPDFGIFYPQKK